VSAIEAVSPAFFEDRPVPPPVGSTEFSLHLWEMVKARAILPQFDGGFSDDPELRREFLVGARRMGLELVDLDDSETIAAMAKMSPPRKPLQPQQLVIADALNAIHDTYVVEIVRRAAKTTTILCWVLGRCECRPGYQVTFSAQSGVKGSARLREWARQLDVISPPDDGDLPPWLRGQQRTTKAQSRQLALFGMEVTPSLAPHRRGFRIMLGEVGKGIYWENGSSLLVLKPDASAYRGEAADVSWIDEAQEIDPLEGADLMAGIKPLQDTKPGAAIVLSGTAGEARIGVFWEHVERLRRGDARMGGLDYCAPEDTEFELIDNSNPDNEEHAMELLLLVHPGVGTLTTMEKQRANWQDLPTPQWAREYLSLWPETFGVRVIPSELWDAAGLDKKLAMPTRVAFGLAIHPGGSVAAIVAAWRNSRGVAYVEVVEHRSGTDWVPKRGQELCQRYRGSTIAYDDIGEGAASAVEMARLRPKPRLRVVTYRQQAAACVQILRDIERGKLKHFKQVGLNEAAARAAKRQVKGDNGLWLWGITASGGDITTLNAATTALRNWDQNYAGKTTTNAPIMGN